MMANRRHFPVLHYVLIGLLIGQFVFASLHLAPVAAAPRSSATQASAPSPASGPSLSVNRAGATTIPPSGIVALIATLEAGAGFTLANLEASSSPDGPWQTLGTFATPGPITVSTGFDLTATAFGGSTTPGPRTIVVRATDSAGSSSTVTLPLTFDDQLDSFTDTGSSPYLTAIRQLATRGVIKGYGDGRFGPNDTTLRAQMAALIARAMGWDLEDYGNPFADRGGLDANLWRNVGTLGHYQVAFGYDGVRFGPNDQVLQAQVISFITRGMVALGYWQYQTANPTLFPNIPADSLHQRDLTTYIHYVGAVPGTTPGQSWPGWTAPATRGWFAQALWQVVQWRENGANWLIIQPPAIANPSDGVAVRASTADRQPGANGSVAIGGRITDDTAPLSGVAFEATITGQGNSCTGASGNNGEASCELFIPNALGGEAALVDITFTRSGQTYRGRIAIAPTGGIPSPSPSPSPSPGTLPPDPSTVASAINRTVATDIFGATTFLYTGENPIQTGVDDETIDSRYVAVLRGKVSTRDGQPLSGVTITILGHPEFGQTLSRADGRYDLVVNGGGPLTVRLARSGYLPADRIVAAPWRDYAQVPDAIMIPLDPQVTTIDLGAATPIQVARGSQVTDSDGTRQATVFFPQGTTATMALPGGGTQPIATLNVRATEYTVGTNGPTAMPAPLPPTSGYTYAVEFSVDEALAAGATGVQFSQPLPVYLENFLDFPVGTIAPVGFYDRAKGQWIPAPNGLVVKIVTITSGRADLDLDGDGNADDGAALGITDAERAQLASLYAVGQSLWRLPISHFSPYDYNWPWGAILTAIPPGNALNPFEQIYRSFCVLDRDRFIEVRSTYLPDFHEAQKQEAAHRPRPRKPRSESEELKDQLSGEALSFIPNPFVVSDAQLLLDELEQAERDESNHEAMEEVSKSCQKKLEEQIEENQRKASQANYVDTSSEPGGVPSFSPQEQILEDQAPQTGDGAPLHNSSGRATGRAAAFTRDLTLSGATLPDGLIRVDLEITVAGQRIVQSFAPTANLRYTFTWDGRDAYGRQLQGEQPVTVRVGYVYPGLYYQPVGVDFTFGLPPGTIALSNDTDRLEVTIWRTGQGTVGLFDWLPQGLGGWSLADHHIYDPNRHILYLGDGTTRRTDGLNTLATNLVPGSDAAGTTGPVALAIRPDGGLLLIGEHQVILVRTDGTSEVVAGTGEAGGDGDGGPAIEAQLNDPVALALGPDGSLYIAERAGHRVRRVAPDGTISTFAGTGAFSFSGDGGLATLATFFDVRGVAAAPDGSVYIADTDGAGIGRVRRVGTDGRVMTIVGGGALDADGVIATSVSLHGPVWVSLGPDGSLFVAEDQRCRVRRVGTDGVISTVAGNGTCALSTTPGPATQSPLLFPQQVVVARDGTLYIAERDASTYALHQVDPDGTMTVLASTSGLFCCTQDPGAPPQQFFLKVASLALDAAGQLHVGHFGNNSEDPVGFVVRLQQRFPGAGGGTDLVIADEDGLIAYVFSAAGRHLRTIHTLTGATLQTFAYDTAGRLITITDSSSNVRTVERDANGLPTGIVDPYGQETALTVNGDGYLLTSTNPAGETTEYTYHAGGLLATRRDPGQGLYEYAYDSLGRLARVNDPEGSFITLGRAELENGQVVTVTTALDRVTTYRTERLPDGTTREEITFPDGTEQVLLVGPAGNRHQTTADGTTVETVEVPDPRFGMDAPITSELTVTTPGGRTLAVTWERDVDLTDPTDLFSVIQIADLFTVNGLLWTRFYQANNRTFTMNSAASRTVSRTIDPAGRLVQQQIGSLEPTHYTYDSRGRLSLLTQGVGPSLRSLTLTYHPEGYLASITDHLSRSVSFLYDEAGRVISKTLPGGRTITLTYDANGNLATLTPPGKPAHTFTHNGRNQLASYVLPTVPLVPATTTSFTYNLDGQPLLTTLPTGRQLGYNYEPNGRLQSINFSAGDLIFGYNPTTGLLSDITAPGVDPQESVTLAFTRDGRLVTGESWTGPVAGSVTRTYDNNFRLSSITVGGEMVTYGYDNGGVVTGAGPLTLTPNSFGQIGQLTLGSVTETRGFNDFGETTSAHAKYVGTDLYDRTMTLDDAGRISEVSETIDGTTIIYAYTYDDAGRLSEVRIGGNLVRSYTYDDNGNRLQQTVSPQATGVYDDQDRLISYGGTTYAYNEDGQRIAQTTDGETTVYGYDEFGHLRRVILDNGTQIDYLIDGLGRRIGKLVDGDFVQGWLYGPGPNPVAELDESGAIISRFIYASRPDVPDYMVKGNDTYRIIADERGSVRLVVDVATGDVVQRLDYDEFGRVVESDNPGFQPFRFAGGLGDPETTLLLIDERNYDPAVGRWVTPMPQVSPGATNRYVYADNDPINRDETARR